MIKVCHISTVHKAFDVRIFHKECVSLAENGFDVSLVVSHDKKEIVQGVKMVPLPLKNGRFFRLFFKTKIAFIRALRTKSKIYHLHDPELFFVGLYLRILGKKVIFDSHELVYQSIVDKNWIGNKFARRFVAGGYRILEKLSLRFFTKIALAESGYLPYFEENYPKRLDKIIFIRNFPIIKMINESIPNAKDESLTTLIYVGGLTKIRGIKEICEAVNLVERPVRLLLLGKWESEAFKESCLAKNDKVNYLGLLPLPEVYPIMKTADIGFATLYPIQNHKTSLCIKTFEYMACGLPMIISNFESWQDFFSEYALFVDPLNVSEIAQKITYCIENKEELKDMGEKGKTIVKKEYNWAAESLKMTDVYNSILH